MAATLSPADHRHNRHHHQYVSRRDASPSTTRPSRDNSSSRGRQPSRPRLLRACATEPSITTSNSSSGVLTVTAPNTANRRATELLSRVAVSNSNSNSYNSAAAEGLLRLSPTTSPSSSTHSFIGGGGEGDEVVQAQRAMLRRSCTGGQQYQQQQYQHQHQQHQHQNQQQQQCLSPSPPSLVSVSSSSSTSHENNPQSLTLTLTLTTFRELLDSANYFSFPSFDEWEQPAAVQQSQEKAY